MADTVEQLRVALGLTQVPWRVRRDGTVHQTLPIILRSRRTRRQILADLPEAERARREEQATVMSIDLDEPDVIHTEVTIPRVGGPQGVVGFFEAMSLDQWLEWEAGKIPPGYDVEPSPRLMRPAESGRIMTGEAAGIAGVGASTWRAYVARGQAPAPVEHVGRTPLWDRTEVQAWAQARPGRGARTDLRADQ